MSIPRRVFAPFLGIPMILGLMACGPQTTRVEDRAPPQLSVGAASIDITPQFPVRLSGYASRAEATETVASPIQAQALALSDSTNSPSVWITLDAIGVSSEMSAEISRRLEERFGVTRKQLIVSASHSHSTPHLDGVLPNMFLQPLPEEQQQASVDYTQFVIDQLETVAAQAIENMQPGYLDWGVGSLDFAINRRVLVDGLWSRFGEQPDGPKDRDLPVLKVSDVNGDILAILVSYACHCTTLGGDSNAIHGDWAGVARERMLKNYPQAIPMIAIGCGADQNPAPRGKIQHVNKHGQAVANAAQQVLSRRMRSLGTAPTGEFQNIQLYFDPLPDRATWESRAASEDAPEASRAQRMLQRLDNGESIPESMDYPVQTWTFGDDLALVALAGEVVVDYALNLKERFDSDRLWVTAYANDVISYIPSKRLYAEGGYEVDRSMVYYDWPQRLAPDTEERILDEVLRQLPHTYDAPSTQARIPPPIDKDDALATIRTRPGIEVSLVAAEPLVQDPVDIAWDATGRLWVVEMADYPLGVDGEPGGRVRVLEDTDGDHQYDRSTVFLESIPFPNSVLPWKDGALVISAPHIFYATDTDGDGRADRRKTLLTGFDKGNPQHLVAGLTWGLDGWIYSGHGNGEGGVRGRDGSHVDLNGKDFRFDPETGNVEGIVGQTQFGRPRDDWGHWFGSDNLRPGWLYALDDRELARNPYIQPPNLKVALTDPPAAGRVYPASRTMSRFNDYDTANRFTSVCNLMIYRGDAMGSEFYGNAFVCEPVHNLVSRRALDLNAPVPGSRVEDETESEFFASTDNWSRPTAIRQGPDGALYVVDMYRLVIEHPEWIPEDWTRKLDLRDGWDKGRIYRLAPENTELTTGPRLSDLDPTQWIPAFDTLNGWTRDTIHQLTLWNASTALIPEFRRLVLEATHPQARAHALWVLKGLNGLDWPTVAGALEDGDAKVRSQAIRLARGYLSQSPEALDALLRLTDYSQYGIDTELLYALGDTEDPRATEALAAALPHLKADAYKRAAAWSSLIPHVARIRDLTNIGDFVFRGLADTAVGLGDRETTAHYLREISSTEDLHRAFPLMLAISESMRRFQPQWDPNELAGAEIASFVERAQKSLNQDDETWEPLRYLALRLFAFLDPDGSGSPERLLASAGPLASPEFQRTAVGALVESRPENVAERLIGAWPQLGPIARETALSRFMEREDRVLTLLHAGAANPSLIAGLDEAARARLRVHRNGEIRALAESLFQAVDSDRSQVLDQYASSLESEGDSVHGSEVFAQHCALCHEYDGAGTAVGPDLTALTNRSRTALLTAILDPNRAVESKYLQSILHTNDGDVYSGVIAESNANAVELRLPGGVQQTVLRGEIATIESSNLSLMPEGLELAISVSDMADLLAYLEMSVRQPIVAEEDGGFMLVASKALVRGAGGIMDPESGALTLITDDNVLVWEAQNVPAGRYAIFTEAAVGPSYQGRPFVLELNDEVLRGQIEHTGGYGWFPQRKFGDWVIDEPVASLRIRLRHEIEGPALALKELRLEPIQ